MSSLEKHEYLAEFHSMGMGNDGHNYNLVREQSKRLSLSRLTFLRITSNQKFITNCSFVHDAILPNDEGRQKPV